MPAGPRGAAVKEVRAARRSLCHEQEEAVAVTCGVSRKVS